MEGMRSQPSFGRRELGPPLKKRGLPPGNKLDPLAGGATLEPVGMTMGLPALPMEPGNHMISAEGTPGQTTQTPSASVEDPHFLKIELDSAKKSKRDTEKQLAEALARVRLLEDQVSYMNQLQSEVKDARKEVKKALAEKKKLDEDLSNSEKQRKEMKVTIHKLEAEVQHLKRQPGAPA